MMAGNSEATLIKSIPRSEAKPRKKWPYGRWDFSFQVTAVSMLVTLVLAGTSLIFKWAIWSLLNPTERYILTVSPLWIGEALFVLVSLIGTAPFIIRYLWRTIREMMQPQR